MNITYLIGNGFDIGLELKTDYKSFYPFFISNAKNNNMLRIEIEKDKNNSFENWSDLELSLGKYVESVTGNNLDMFIESKIELDELLVQYLQGEEAGFSLTQIDMKNIMLNALLHFKIGNNEQEKNRINNTLEYKKAEEFIYKCITFNYTGVIDMMWDSVKNSEIGRHPYGSSYKKEVTGGVIHVHGTLYDSEMILGVNDETQIMNLELSKRTEMKWTLIKPFLNKDLGNNKTQRAKQVIGDSSIVCIYGMSIGATDKIWWEYIGEWLTKSIYNLLIIYNYDNDYKKGHPAKHLMYKQKVKNDFLNNTNLDSGIKSRIENQIIIYNNQNIFSKKMIEKIKL